MPDGSTAADRLVRLLHVLPAASVEGGASLERLASDLGVESATILDDLTEVTARSFYHPAGSGDDIQIQLEPNRVSVWTKGAFRRPVKLTPLEAFCLALGLRHRALERERTDGSAPTGAARAALLDRVEAYLATGPAPQAALRGVHAADAGPDPDGVRQVLIACARERTRCRIQYLKPAAAAPAERVLHPWAVVHAEGRWYVVAWCETSEGARTFRLDRILDAEPCEGRFERPDQVEVEAFLSGGRVYHADHDTEVVVRYSPGVARWIEEWAPAAEPTPGGGLLVRHHISDPGWVVRHVLAYAGEAEVVEPAELRACVVEAVGEGDSPHSNRSMRS